MGSKLSKSQETEPQLYAVATPHPTSVQYIYPVYAAPLDLPSNPSARRGSVTKNENRTKKRIKIISEKEAAVLLAHSEVAAQNDDDDQTGHWFHYHVDETGAIDYVQPGTTVPQHLVSNSYIPAPFGSPVTPSTAGMSMIGSGYDGSSQTYPLMPGYPVYQSDHQPLSPQPYAYVPQAPPPRARSVSPKRSRAITPTGKPRRATTPTPRHVATPTYEPAPPMPLYNKPAPRRARTATPFPRTKALPYIPHRASEEEPSLGGYSNTRRSRRSSAEESVETSTAIGIQLDLFPPVPTSTSGTRSRPFSPIPPSEMSSLGKSIPRPVGWGDSIYSDTVKP